ncbi:hypothetical protein [Brevibacillus dissolubilis]|uniref:hypothetical protein n=1 Tax=Brevibacillus dissolubilis TaxID=1844116 RepID=UPI001116AAD2|nr:hypothetical protein [Brevibacillus dissolubilis]
MLINVLQDATDRLEKNKTSQERVRDLAQFESNIKKILDIANKMDSILEVAIEAKRQIQMPIVLELTLRNDLISTMRSVLEQAQDGFLDNEVVRNLSRNADDLRGYFNSSWTQTVSEEAKQVATSLDTFGRFMSNPDEASQIKLAISSRIQALPSQKNDVSLFASNLKKGREMADQAGDDPEIKMFIKKVLDKQASLADITPNVQEWIRKHKLEQRTKISFA